ncbi:ATP-binding SpoIIE family protein phosphatase [Streptomyces sp. 7N604]|uniref:ATP-binding SpoIIE family protein phosphatase n=1 Tax=Streptomyces sp. 7N604 TaxID=3457415 RepID=UPI003FCF340B
MNDESTVKERDDHTRSQAAAGRPGVSALEHSASADRDVRLADVLRRAVEQLSATAAILYVPVDSNRVLSASVVVGGPVSIFAAIDRIEVDDDRFSVSVAYRTNEQVVSSYGQARINVPLPFPYTVASTPLLAAGVPRGVLTILWAPPQGPRELLPREKRNCLAMADELANELLKLGEPPPSPQMPHFLMPIPGQASGTLSELPGDGRDQGSSKVAEYPGLAFLYRIYKLACALTEKVRLHDIIDIAVSHIMVPFAAQGMVVSVIHEDAPRVLGYTGYSADVARSPFRAKGGANGAGARIPVVESALFLESAAAMAAAGPFGEGKQACALLPLVIGGHREGVFVLGFEHPHRFGSDERAALVTMAGLLGQSLGRARLFEAERSMARGLQRGLLPHMLPHLEQLDTAVRYSPAKPGVEVGGDWYDVLVLPDEGVGLIIGDVEGHSPAGAAIMGQIRSAVRAYAAEGHRPGDLLGRTNRLLAELGIDQFATCCCIWLDLTDGTAEISSAGHPTPLLSHPDSGIVVPDVSVGLPLGVAPDTVYPSAELTVAPGTLLALYTDGLVCSRSVDLTSGTRALHELLAEGQGQRLEELATRLIGIVGGPESRDDDVALLLARYDGAGPDHRRVGRMSVHRHDLQSVKGVRDFVHEHLRHWGWEEVSYEAELMATELVTNALIHADSDVDVRLRELPDLIRVEVRDWDPRPPMPAPITLFGDVDSEAEHGRGLVIVEALASGWGNSPSGRGKAVWFEMSRAAEPG